MKLYLWTPSLLFLDLNPSYFLPRRYVRVVSESTESLLETSILQGSLNRVLPDSAYSKIQRRNRSVTYPVVPFLVLEPVPSRDVNSFRGSPTVDDQHVNVVRVLDLVVQEGSKSEVI